MRTFQRLPGVVLVSLAAAMWGLDGLIRKRETIDDLLALELG